ncbi:hypothetical protein Ciccas_013746 [Cichlidogyrus casuarinus]|uniref:Uncharacterized protein n=1 Tax=Cichlidogyrus casuarinus TaxID=1844966 RepID=A0ABD2PJT1_9PLAT
MQGVSRGCVPLCPNRLVYPELFSADSAKLFDGGCLYSTTTQLAKRLINWITRPARLRKSMISVIQSNFENPNFLKHPEIVFGFHGKLKDQYKRLISS